MKTIKTKAGRERNTIAVHEDFIPYHTKQLDSKNRITLGGKLTKILGGKMNIDSYQILVGKKGDILLRPIVAVPSSEAWVYRNPLVISKVRKGLGEARDKKAERAVDLDSFLESL